MSISSPSDFRRLLDQSLQADSGSAPSKAVRERLFLARRKALDAVPEPASGFGRVFLDQSLASGSPGAAALGFGRRGVNTFNPAPSRLLDGLHNWFGRSSWFERTSGVLLLVLMLGSLQYALEEAEVRVLMREGETDAQLLSDELPLDAYADRGFVVFLRNITASGLDTADESEADPSEPEASSESAVESGPESQNASGGS